MRLKGDDLNWMCWKSLQREKQAQIVAGCCILARHPATSRDVPATRSRETEGQNSHEGQNSLRKRNSEEEQLAAYSGSRFDTA